MQTESETLTALGNETAIVVSPARAMLMLDCGRTKLYELIEAGEVESYLDGSARKITVASIHARILRMLQASRQQPTAA
jgi:hypothetical protein